MFQRFGQFIAGGLLAFGLTGWALYGYTSHRSARALADAEAACVVRIVAAVDAAHDGYVVPTPTPVPPPVTPTPRPPKRSAPPPRTQETVKPATPPGDAVPPNDAAGGAGVNWEAWGPYVPPGGDPVPSSDWPGNCLCFSDNFGRTSCDPPGCNLCDRPDCPYPAGTCDVDVRAGLVRARATCGGADVPCTVTGDGLLPVPTIPPPVAISRWSAELRAGAGSDGWALGASVYGRSRWGGWVQADDRGGSGGVAIRLGR